MQILSQPFVTPCRGLDPIFESHAANISETLNLSQAKFSEAHIYENTKITHHIEMDTKSIRRANLLTLIAGYSTQSKFAEAVDTAPAYISQILSNDHPANLGTALARKIEKNLNLEHGWMDREHTTDIAEEKGNAILTSQNEEALRILSANAALKAGEISLEEYAEQTNSIALPFYDIKASCGTGELIFEVISHKFYTDKNELNRLGLKPEHTFWCRAAGDSMEPTVKDGDRLLVEQLDGHSLTDVLNNKIYLFSWNGELFCKRLIRQMDGSLLVKSDNSENHRDTLITTEQIGQMKLIGRVRQAHTPPTML